MTRPRTLSLSAAALALALPVLLSACGGSSEADEKPSYDKSAPLHSALPKDLQGKKSITIASNVEYPPFEFLDTDNKTVLGIDREIADGLEKQLGIDIEFDNIAFDAIIPGLASGRYQMAMSAMTDNLERQKEVDFVDYFAAGAGIMTHEADADKYTTLADMCGTTVAVVKGTTEVPQAEEASKQCEADSKDPIKATVFPGQNQVILALQNERVDAILMDSAPGAYAASQTEGLVMSKPYESQPFGIVFAKGTDELQKAVQQALQALKDNGEYDKALEKFGLESGAIDEFTINGGTQ
ncbi:ABC transporter substrate-binding protein [Nocardioides sp. SLBN-35]|uniref:ABC transporter substrate-binding protein n=1 Tax=Nocardioides sp. SLBN-35 TaxID=2768445 RepID=UPI00114E3F0D|nr:ABC transporter substrate-binding protein [Nocardioides sp. SLBN-35]TQK68415.1 polar amino acid transport system substrate-binding protein [Nocardioides sp. SLBN-35]